MAEMIQERSGTHKRKLKTLDLFSGIGGFSLGLERAGGFETVAFCEIEDYPRRVLAKHWPGVPCYDDVNTLPLARGMADMVTAGFPCQDVSFAGQGAGLAGARSGLWWKVRRTLRVVRPRLALLENVAALLNRGMGTVLGSMAAIGYDAEWHCIQLARSGAPHERDRCWIIVTDTHANSQPSIPVDAEMAEAQTACDVDEAGRPHTEGMSGPTQQNWGPVLAPADVGQRARHWQAEPPVVRVVHGIPGCLDEADPAAVAALGNSASPIQVEIIGRAIMQAEGMTV